MERSAFLKQLAGEYAKDKADIALDTTFEQLGMDSYEIVDFMLKVEEHFGIVIDDEKMLSMKSLDDVCNAIACTEEEQSECSRELPLHRELQ